MKFLRISARLQEKMFGHLLGRNLVESAPMKQKNQPKKSTIISAHRNFTSAISFQCHSNPFNQDSVIAWELLYNEIIQRYASGAKNNKRSEKAANSVWCAKLHEFLSGKVLFAGIPMEVAWNHRRPSVRRSQLWQITKCERIWRGVAQESHQNKTREEKNQTIRGNSILVLVQLKWLGGAPATECA